MGERGKKVWAYVAIKKYKAVRKIYFSIIVLGSQGIVVCGTVVGGIVAVG